MTYPKKLSELLELTTASRKIAEANTRQAEAAGTYGEFAGSDMSGGIVGDEMAERILPSRKPSKWDREFAHRAQELAKEKAITARKYKALMSYG